MTALTTAMYSSAPETAIPTGVHDYDSGAVSAVREQIAELWSAGVSAVRIGSQLGFSEIAILKQARCLGLPSRSQGTPQRLARRERIVEMWNTGKYTLAAIGVTLGLKGSQVQTILKGARRAGAQVSRFNAILSAQPEDPQILAMRERVVTAWNAGKSTQSEIGMMFGLRSRQVKAIISAARCSGMEVLRIDFVEAGRRGGSTPGSGA